MKHLRNALTNSLIGISAPAMFQVEIPTAGATVAIVAPPK